MADKIQLTIESFVPELEVLVQKGVFSKIDVKKIIKKRRYHEYQFEKKMYLPLTSLKQSDMRKSFKRDLYQIRKSLR